uniref:Interleukin 10 receptor subunit beta n=1 Tax=Bos indicus x Bos taurus TaxID=30522 RepID=A0A4W2DXG3_BOBOX
MYSFAPCFTNGVFHSPAGEKSPFTSFSATVKRLTAAPGAGSERRGPDGGGPCRAGPLSPRPSPGSRKQPRSWQAGARTCDPRRKGSGGVPRCLAAVRGAPPLERPPGSRRDYGAQPPELAGRLPPDVSYRKFQDTCTSILLTECDFSSLSKYGDHTLRVRAEFADESSEWINITFCPVDDTTIGPPRMQVEALANSLHVRFFAPRIENEPEPWTMRNIYNSWTYHVRYWKNGSDEKFSISGQYDFEFLRNLESQTTYCVQVRGFLSDRNKAGEWSEPVCEQTTIDETTPSWMVASVLAASVCAALLLLLGCFFLLRCVYRKARHAFPPRNSLPQHLKEDSQSTHCGGDSGCETPTSAEEILSDS